MADTSDTISIIRDRLRAAGYGDAAINGVLANVRQESNFDPTLRHADQPRWGGEAHYAHGLYQEGGQEWNNYAAWLQSNNRGDWRDPANQTDFLVSRLQSPDYQRVNAVLTDPNASGMDAAKSFASGYLRPANQYLQQRFADWDRNGLGLPGDASSAPGASVPASPVAIASAAPAGAGGGQAPEASPSVGMLSGADLSSQQENPSGGSALGMLAQKMLAGSQPQMPAPPPINYPIPAALRARLAAAALGQQG